MHGHETDSVDSDSGRARAVWNKSVRQVAVLQIALITGALVTIALCSRADQWQDLNLFFLLLAFAALAKILMIEVQQDLLIFGDFLPTLLAAVLLGPAPAAVMGLLTVQARWLRQPIENMAARAHARLKATRSPFGRATRFLLDPFSVKSGSLDSEIVDEPEDDTARVDEFQRPLYLGVLMDHAQYAWSPLIAGLLFHLVADNWNLTYLNLGYYVLFAGVFAVALIYDLISLDIYDAWIDNYELGSSLKLELFLIPIEIVAMVLGAVALYAFKRFGALSSGFMVGDLALILIIYWRAQYGRVTKKRIEFEKLTERVKVLAQHHGPTGTHSAAVAHYTYTVAKASGMSFKDQVLAYRAGLVHDVGKVDWPIEILNGTIQKPSDDNWKLMVTHPVTGADRLERIGEHKIAEVIRYHHVNQDGSGYPDDLDLKKMPEIAMIIRVADTFDCMTARDAYRKPVSPEESFAELHRCSSLCPESERTQDYRGYSWREEFNAKYVLAFEKAWQEDPSLGYNHQERQIFEDALDFYKNGLRRKRVQAEPNKGTSEVADASSPRIKPA